MLRPRVSQGVATGRMVPVFGRDLHGKAEGNWCKNCKMDSQQADFEAAAKQSTAVNKVCYFARPPQSCTDLERQLAHWFRLRLASGVCTDPNSIWRPGASISQNPSPPLDRDIGGSTTLGLVCARSPLNKAQDGRQLARPE